MFTEYGADTVMGLHDTTPVMFTEEYQTAFYEMYSRVFDSYDFVMGEQVWNFADFATSQGIVRVQGNKKGPQTEACCTLDETALALHPELWLQELIAE